MTTLTGFRIQRRKIISADGGKLTDMLGNTKVLVTAILTGGVVVVALVGALAYLAAKSADASTILTVVSMLLSAVTLARTYAIGATVSQVQQQTNGTQTALINHAISSPASEPAGKL